MTGATGVSLAITGVAAVTPVGHSAEETCAAIRAGLTGFGDHPFFDVETKDPGWDPEEMLTMAMVSLCDRYTEGPARLLELSLFALQELVAKSRLRRAELARTALLLALPGEDEVVKRWQLSVTFAEALCSRAGLPLFTTRACNQDGHNAVFHLLQEAERILAEGRCTRCIMLAADSYHDEERLAAMDQRFRLRSERTVDGFIPGEAAAALLLERSSPGAPRVELVAAADEPHPYTSDLSSTGRGLQGVLEPLLPYGSPRPWLVCDLNGESYRAFEWGLMRSRLSPGLDQLCRLDHPAENIGDVGTATGALLLAHCAQAFKRGYAPADRALIFTAHDGPQRMGVVVARS